MSTCEAQSTASLASLDAIAGRLCCPACRKDLAIRESELVCESCNSVYPSREGIPSLIPSRSGAGWLPGGEVRTSDPYKENYQEIHRAARYNEKYKKQAMKRASTNREFSLIRKLLGSQPHSQVLLDLPSGGGRLSPQLAPYADMIIESDIAIGQLIYGREDSKLDTPQVWIHASAFDIPLKDQSVDGIFCCRLCHHLPSAPERERLMVEILRVSKRFALMTFFDHHSIKNTVRRLRRPFNKKSPKMTMTVARVRELAKQHGFELVACHPLSRLFSGHRYALMVRKQS